jgi:glycosyltransferase involved in cell wall biosynthesis
MRVTMMNWSDSAGGAARAALRTHLAVRAAGVDSTFLVQDVSGHVPATVLAAPTPGLVATLTRRSRRRRFEAAVGPHLPHIAAEYQIFSTDLADDPDRAVNGFRSVGTTDILHLHWVSRFVDFPRFFSSLPAGLPIVWTLHDMNAFTGGCHFDARCGRFESECGRCPALESPVENDLSREVFDRKIRSLAGITDRQLVVVSPSRWLASESRRSRVLGRFEHLVIPYGLETDLFRPVDKGAARKILGLEPDARVVMFIAEGATLKRKGAAYLVEAARLLRDDPKIAYLSLGRTSAELPPGVPHVAVGHLNNDKLLPMAYSAADVVVVPSTQDNFPNTVLESMACGTPVVGFDIGGIPDMIRDGITGRVVPARDSAALAAAIRDVLSDEPRRQIMAAACRRIAVEEYSLQAAARQYLGLYDRLRDRAAAGR